MFGLSTSETSYTSYDDTDDDADDGFDVDADDNVDWDQRELQSLSTCVNKYLGGAAANRRFPGPAALITKYLLQ